MKTPLYTFLLAAAVFAQTEATAPSPVAPPATTTAPAVSSPTPSAPSAPSAESPATPAPSPAPSAQAPASPTPAAQPTAPTPTAAPQPATTAATSPTAPASTTTPAPATNPATTSATPGTTPAQPTPGTTPTGPESPTAATANTQPTPQESALPPEANTPVQGEAGNPATAETAPASSASTTTPATTDTGAQVSVDNSGNVSAGNSQGSVSANADGGAGVSAGGTSASVNSSGGASVNSGSLSVGLMELDGESVTRISYRPEFEFGKLGVALDIELFIDSDGNFKSDGWEFDTQEQVLNTIYRKIYYVRWDKPGAPFYARVGALEGLDFDAAGLVMNGWGNVANYPSQKLLGVHTQINEDITPLAISLDVATNSALDWNKGGGVLATKLGVAPLTSLGLPIISDLRLQGVFVSDFNQKAAVPDRDEDGCPDDLDANTGRGQVCSSPNIDVTQLPTGDQERLDYISEFEDQLAAEDKRIKDDFAVEDPFTMVSVEALLPIVSSEFFELNVFTEAAKPWDEEDLDDAWAVVPLGASGHLSIFQYGLQYRIMDGEFYPGHFDAAYEMQRMTFDNGRYISKQELFWSEDLGKRKGIYGSLGANLWNVAELSGSYSHLIAEDPRFSRVDGIQVELPDDKSFSTSAGLGQTILSYIPKVSKAEVFFSKTRIGQDYRLEYTEENPEVLGMATDSFFQKSRFTTWGFTVGSDLGGGLQLNVTRATTFERIATGDGSSELVPNDNFYAETVLSF